MKKFVVSLLLQLFVSSVFSQQLRDIKGKVIDTDGNPIEFASAVVVNDSLNIRFGADTDSLGRYKFSAREGRYLFEISLLGYKKFQSEIVIDADKVMPDVVMELVSEKIKGATIVESRVDHNVSGYKLNVKNKKYMQQMDLVEIFATAPGLFIGDDVKIYGKSVQTVYIDRRKVKMTGYELVNYLKMYQGKNIDNIEVIINSGLDEIGTGGAIIKISTIKDKGGFGSISNRFLFNAHKLVESPSININHRTGKLSLYLNSSYMTMKSDRENTTLYQWDKVDANASSINKNNLRLPNSSKNVMGFGYDISKNDFISFEISYQHLIRNTFSDYAYEKVVGGIASDESYKRGVENKNTINNYAATLMYVHTFKDKSELEIKGDYYGQDVTKRLMDTIPEIYESNWRKSIKDNDNSDSYLFSAKYSKSFFGNKDKFMSGVYYSNINQTIANITDNIIVKKRTYLESTFDYSEDVVYGYSSYSYNFKKFSLRGGLRGEFSNINKSNYFNVIPEITAAWFINKQKGNILRANYRRNIYRPNITHLNTNPTITEDASIINIGNKDLLPYLSNTYSLGFVLNNNYMLRVAHSHADDMQTSYMYYDDNNLIYRTYINGATKNTYGVSLDVSYMPSNFISLNANCAFSHDELSTADTKSFNNEFSYFVSGNFNIKKACSINLLVFGNTQRLTGINYTTNTPALINLSLSKKLFKGAVNVSVGVNDIFDSDKSQNTIIETNDYRSSIKSNYSSRTYTISVTANLNWGKRTIIRKAQSGSQDVQGRMKE